MKKGKSVEAVFLLLQTARKEVVISSLACSAEENLQHLPTPPAWIQHGLTLSYTPAHVRPVKGYCSTAFSRMRLTGWTHLHSPRANRSNERSSPQRLRDRPHLSTSFSNVIQNIAEGAGGEGDHTNILCLISHFKIPVSDVRPWRN